MTKINTISTKFSNAKMLAKTLARKPVLLPRLASGYLGARFLDAKVLRFMDIAIDYRCNMHCNHCSAVNFLQKNVQEISYARFSQVADELAEEGCMVLHFTGGEPLLREDLEDFIEASHPERFIISIQSNGLLATESRLKSLQKVGVDIFNVSIDSGEPIENDRFRGVDGAWERATESIILAQKLGFEVSVATTVSHENIHSKGLLELIEWTKRKHIWCQFNLAAPVGNWRECGNFLLTEEDQFYWRELLLRYSHLRIDLNHNWHHYGCGAVKEKGYLTSYGDFMPCPFIQISLGNVNELSISEIRRRALQIPEFASYHPKCLAAEDMQFISKTPCYNSWKGLSPVPISKVEWMTKHIELLSQ